MNGIIRYVLMLIAIGATGCGSRQNAVAPTADEVVGIYMGRYGGGVATFEIRTNGTFLQLFRIGTNLIYESTGKWEMARGQSIDFKPFVVPKGVYRRSSDQRFDAGGGSWVRGPIRIEFGPWPYHIAKVAGHGATVDKAAFK